MATVDKLKIERKILQRLFDGVGDDLDKELNSPSISKEKTMRLLKVLEDKISRIFNIDEKISEMMVTQGSSDTEMEAEMVSVEVFREKIIYYRNKVDYYFLSTESQAESNVSTKHKLLLPKLNLKKFDGDVKKWIGFWGQFRKIDEDESIDIEYKFEYLLQSTEENSAARTLIESYPPSVENYKKALEQLKARFGRDEFLIEVYVRELLNLVLKQATGKSNISIASLYDSLESQLRNLETLGVTTDKYAAMLYPLVESALPEDIMRVWERHRNTNKFSKNTNLLNNLLDFLKTEVESEERIHLAKSFGTKEQTKMIALKAGQGTKSEMQGNGKQTRSGETHLPTAATILTGSKDSKEKYGKRLCIFCNCTWHSSQDCIKAQSMTLGKRKEIVSQKKVCFDCLKPFHNIKNCKTFIKCIVCGKKHYALLCPELSLKENTSEKITENKQNEESVLISNPGGTLMQPIALKIVHRGESKVVRAILDSASQRSYILSSCAKNLRLPKLRDEQIVQSLFGGTQLIPKIHSLYKVKIQNLDGTFEIESYALEQNKICNFIPRLENNDILRKLQMEDIYISDTQLKSSDISLLLGADIYGRLITGTLKSIGNLTAIETRLGWTIMGSQNLSSKLETLCCFNNLDISDLWNMETIGIKDPISIKSKDEIEAETIKKFNETIKRKEDGKYEVCLPWLDNCKPLDDNRQQAECRFFSTTKKLKNLNKFESYDKIFLEWENLGIIEEVKNLSSENTVHYIPHHAVIKESSNTTKLRPVFDASAKDSNGNSLNNSLEKGPNLIELIPEILVKFRLGLIGVISDIKKAFLMIGIAEKDRDVLRFLWWKDASMNEIKIYRHTRVVFGVSSSPFLLGATIMYHLDQTYATFPETINKLKESFYVDNCVTSVDSMRELKTFVNESKTCLSSGGFDLRGWIYNAESFFKEDESEMPCNGSSVSVLGLVWNFEQDVLCCDTSFLEQIPKIPFTKRGLLSAAQRVFDPIGFTSPVTLLPKILLQETWKTKNKWDDPLPSEILDKFKVWLGQIRLLKFCQIPRTFCKTTPLKNCDHVSLHIFCDASKTAYAACIFLRVEINGEIHVNLLLSKSRITPIRKITLPRLELLSALIACRLYRSVRKIQCLQSFEAYFWSDSKVALTWIKTRSNWNTFVNNRVEEIRKYTDLSKWNHVAGISNAADLPSRGCSTKQLIENRWWEGPDWLSKNIEYWPITSISYNEEVAYVEQKKTAVVTNLIVNKNATSENFLYFSKYTMIVRMVAWMFRFYVKVFQENIKFTEELTSEEIEKAENCLIKIIQGESFGKRDKDFQGLEIFRDDNDLLRVKTRIINRDDLECFKYPILLPYNHVIVKRLIEEKHRLSCHAGIQTLWCKLRETFWIIKGKRMIRNVIGACVPCKRQKVVAIESPFSALPKDRVNDVGVFEITGIDLAGPLYLKNKDKVYIVIFTCAVYRACHFELVKALSTEEFIFSLRRFIARRGRVSVIYSDNGTNFHGTENLFNQIDWNEIQKFSSVSRIKWNFIPPTAAWWGGWWERVVRMIKELLRRNLGKRSLAYDELYTVLCDCEAVVNARPLTYNENHTNGDLTPITPDSFLKSLVSSEIPDLDQIERISLKKRLNYLQNIRDAFRKRFRNEYLAMLVQSKKGKYTKIKVGEVVLIQAENMKRTMWPMGKIIEVYPGQDQVIRVVKVKTSNGVLTRPIQRIHRLEIGGEEELTEGLTPETQEKPQIKMKLLCPQKSIHVLTPETSNKTENQNTDEEKSNQQEILEENQQSQETIKKC